MNLFLELYFRILKIELSSSGETIFNTIIEQTDHNRKLNTNTL